MIKVFEPCITKEDLAIASEKCLATGQFDPGQYVDQFEAGIAADLGVPASWVMVTNSCTAALHTCYHFLVGDKFLQAPVLTWPGTYCTHHKVCFYDERPQVGAPNVVVDLYGSGEVPIIGSTVIIDAAHNCLSKDLIQKYLLTGKAAAICFSFGPTKQLTTIRGGAVISPHVSGQWRSFIHYGAHGRQPFMRQGGNYTMPDYNACIGINQLKRFDAMQERRQALLIRYDALPVKKYPSTGHICSVEAPEPKRDYLRRVLAQAGVQTSHHYAIEDWADMPRSSERSKKQITLPLHLKLKNKDVDMICDLVEKVLS